VEATESLERFLRAVHEDPWPDQDLIRRSLARAENMGKSDSSKVTARSLYHALRTPLCVWNCQFDRMTRLITLGMHLDGNNFGECTTRAIQAFEPNPLWERRFLEIRRACYTAMHNPQAKQARRDLDEFINGEAFTADVSALTKVLKSRSSDKTFGAYSIETRPTDLRR
jgi:hypothetical protein